MKKILSESSKKTIENILKETYIPDYPVPSIRDESYILLMLAFSVAKSNIYEMVVHTSFTEDKEEEMIKLGVSVIKGKTTPEAYYNKFIATVKEQVGGKITVDAPDFLKTQIIARINMSKNQIVNVNLKESEDRPRRASIGDFHKDIKNAKTVKDLERVKGLYGQNWFDKLPDKHQNTVARKMMDKIHDIRL